MALKVYNDAEIRLLLADHPDWSLANDGQLHAEFEFKNFALAILFANAIAHLAELNNHHPDICVHNYKYLSIRLMTHSEKGITDRDFNMIREIDALPRRQP
jgi:4a-hydroxytetrahydrobiopterin dehydratase